MIKKGTKKIYIFHKFFVPLRSGKTSSIHIKYNKMENRSLVTIAEHSKEKILYMLEMAKQFEMNRNRRLLQGKVL